MTSSPIAQAQSVPIDLAPLRRLAVLVALFGAIGVELLVLATWLPDTLGVWFAPEKNGYGDFPIFYHNAESISLNAFYSPGLSLLMHPLTAFSMRTAFTIYFAVNVAALAGVAYLAQRGVHDRIAKIAVAFAVFALPQTHWALRVGHFTEILAFASLAGLLLCDRRPVVAGLLIGVLALKPQYLPVPLLYFACTRNWRALGSALGALALLGIAGVAAMALRDGGLHQIAHTARYYIDGAGTDAQFLTLGQRDQSYQQGWQYSWYGVLVSAGIEPNPLIAAELFAVSAAAMVLAWWRCTPAVAKVATALGMLLLTPHTSFYNWSMLAVAAALLLRSDLRPRFLVPAMLCGLAAAAAATQNATPFPLPYDAYRPAGTLGLYWLPPAALLCLIALAIAGRRGDGTDAVVNFPPSLIAPIDADRVRPSERRETVGFDFWRRRALAPMRWTSGAAAMIAVGAGCLGAAYVSGSGPFRDAAYFDRTTVLRALPADFPLPPEAELDSVGAGAQLPYRVRWQSRQPASEVAGLMRVRLADGSWKIAGDADSAGAVTLRSARPALGDAPPVLVQVRIAPDGDGSSVQLEFAPLPVSLVPGYDAWLRHIGIVVHNIDPGSAADRAGR